MILNTGRPRMIAHQWRYLVLPAALIAAAGFLLTPRHSAQNSPSNGLAKDSLGPAKGSPVKATYGAQEQELIEMIRQVAETIPQRWPRYGKARSPDERLLFDDFSVYDKRSSLTIISPRPLQLFGVPRLTKVEVGDFEVSVNGDSAVIDFNGAIHFSFPDQDKDEVVTDPYRVELVKVNGQWQADRRNRDPAAGGVMPVAVGTASLPATLPKTPRGWMALKVSTEMIVVNNGDAEFSVQSSPSFDSSQSGEALLGEPAVLNIQNAVMKLGELELRGEKGIRFSIASKCLQIHSSAQGSSVRSGVRFSPIDKCLQKTDGIRFNDRFELQWGERIYYSSGAVNANYHLPDKRLRIGHFPGARFYRTHDRTGEAMTLQQVAQELKDQAVGKN